MKVINKAKDGRLIKERLVVEWKEERETGEEIWQPSGGQEEEIMWKSGYGEK